jgi:hypothetical protein
MLKRVIKDEIDATEVQHPFDPSKIRIEAKVITLDSLLKRISHNEVDLWPDFQRSNDIWNDKARSRLIESILVRIPLPAFYFDSTNEDKWVVIDGLQRLTTLKRFVLDNKLVLQEMEYLSEYNGIDYKHLPRKFQRRIEETEITAVLVQKGTPDEVKYNIFSRINTGGEPLTPQEIRHALNQGNATKFLMKLAGDDDFKILPKNNKRMDISELLLRVLAYQIFSLDEALKYNLDDLLIAALRELNKSSIEDLKYKGEKIKKCLKVCSRIFGDYAFQKRRKNQNRKNPLNKALFETWVVTLMSLSDDELNKLVIKKERVNQRSIDLMEDPRFYTAISSGKPHSVRYRFQKIDDLVKGVLRSQ